MVNFVFNDIIKSKSKNDFFDKIFGLEFESESESEFESELKLKSNSKFFNTTLGFNFLNFSFTTLDIRNTLLSYLDHILEVPYSPPNFC